MELKSYLDDLESRIDINEERRIIDEWLKFVMRRAPGSVFSPSRRPAPPSALDWPAVNVNDAILDETYETMLLGQLRGVNGVICGKMGNIPMMRANYGSTVMPTLFGCRLHLMERELNTLPGALPLPGASEGIRELLRHGVPDMNGGQGRQVLEASRFFVEKLAPYPKLREAIRIYHPDLQGPLDIAEVVYGSEIFLAFYDEPELMRDFLNLVTETYIAFADYYFSQLPPAEDFNFHYGWLHRGKIRISLDSCVNFSPEMYREFVLPCDRKLFNRYGGVVHSCGKVDHFVDVLPELGGGYHGFNLSQPHLNNMEKVFAATLEQGIRIFGLQPSAAQAASDAGRDLRGLVHSPIECNPDSSKIELNTEKIINMTRKENLRLTLSGKKPQWVPFAPNFYQWFAHHKNFDLLPDELRGCEDYIDAMKALGCDIFSRNVDGGFRKEDTTLQARTILKQAATGPRQTIEYDTQYGTLREIHQEQTDMSTTHQEEYLVKDWKRDGNAFRCFLEQQRYRWDEEAFARTNAKVGDDGIVNVHFGVTPLKMMHLYFGLEYTCFFVMDEPGTAKELCDYYWQEKIRPVLHALANHPQVESAILMDNVDTPFYSPALAAEYWTPYVKEAADVMRAKGKTLFVHACGKLAGLSGEFAEARVSGLEGISHPPLGDWPVADAQSCHRDFIFIGGFSAREQEILTDRQVRDFYQKYLATAKKERFIFASSCQTAVDTKWERLKLVRDICRDWGGGLQSDSQGRNKYCLN